MPRNNNVAPQEEYVRPASVIGEGFTVQTSLITGSDSLRVDGAVIGTIEMDGTLHLSETGFVEGDIHVTSARVAGQVNGNIHCRSMLHLENTSLINGDIYTAAVVVDEGAVLRGRCKTGVDGEGIA